MRVGRGVDVFVHISWGQSGEGWDKTDEGVKGRHLTVSFTPSLNETFFSVPKPAC